MKFLETFVQQKCFLKNLLLCSAPSCQPRLFGGHTGWQILRTNAPYECLSADIKCLTFVETRGSTRASAPKALQHQLWHHPLPQGFSFKQDWCPWNVCFFDAGKYLECYQFTIALMVLYFRKRRFKKRNSCIYIFSYTRTHYIIPSTLPNQSTGELGSKPGSPWFLLDLTTFWPVLGPPASCKKPPAWFQLDSHRNWTIHCKL